MLSASTPREARDGSETEMFPLFRFGINFNGDLRKGFGDWSFHLSRCVGYELPRERALSV